MEVALLGFFFFFADGERGSLVTEVVRGSGSGWRVCRGHWVEIGGFSGHTAFDVPYWNNLPGGSGEMLFGGRFPWHKMWCPWVDWLASCHAALPWPHIGGFVSFVNSLPGGTMRLAC